MQLVEEWERGEQRGRAAWEAARDQESLGPSGAGGCGMEMGGLGLGVWHGPCYHHARNRHAEGLSPAASEVVAAGRV